MRLSVRTFLLRRLRSRPINAAFELMGFSFIVSGEHDDSRHLRQRRQSYELISRRAIFSPADMAVRRDISPSAK